MKRKIIMFIVSIILFVGLSSCDSLVYTTTPVYYDTYTPTTIVVRQTPPPLPYWGYSVNHRVHKHHKHVQK